MEESTCCGEVCVLCETGCALRWLRYDIYVAVEGRVMLLAGVTCVDADVFWPAANCI